MVDAAAHCRDVCITVALRQLWLGEHRESGMAPDQRSMRHLTRCGFAITGNGWPGRANPALWRREAPSGPTPAHVMGEQRLEEAEHELDDPMARPYDRSDAAA